jgi:hypothetical protein
MRTKALSGILLWLALSLLLPTASPAAVVGRLTQVEGEVTLLKKGKLPAIPLKPNDGVETGDVIRTKSLSKAQITFVDDTVLTIAPGSRIAIAKYMVASGKRNAVLQMFRGVALAVVSKIFKANEPDFMVRTNTAIMGVRGTKVGLRLYPNFSEILTFQGHTEVRNRFPEIPGTVQLKDGQGTRVTRGLPPTKHFKVSEQDFKQFMNQLSVGLSARVRDQDAKPDASSSGNTLARSSSSSGELTLVTTTSALQPTAQEKPKEETPAPTVEVKKKVPPKPSPPPIPPPPPPPSSPYYVVNWSSTGQYSMVKGTPSVDGDPHYATYSGSLTLSNGSKANFTISAQDPYSPGNFNQSSSGTITWTVTGNLPLVAGTNSYVGTVEAVGTTTGGTEFKFTFDAKYEDGKLTLTSVGPVSGGYESTSTTGDFTQPTAASHKITDSTAQINWTLTSAATATSTVSTVTPTSLTTVAPTLSATSALSPVSSMNAAVITSTITPLPLPATLSTAGPPGQAVSAAAPGQAVGGPPGQSLAGPPGQAVSAAAPGHSVGAPEAGPVTPSGVPAPGLLNAPGQGGTGIPPGHAYGKGHNK